MNEVLSASDAERKDAIKQGGGIYAFQLKNDQGKTETWYLDLKEQGKVSKGSGGKPDGKDNLFSSHNDLNHISIMVSVMQLASRVI